MNAMLKRFISLMLCFIMVAGYLPVGALAEETGTVQEPSDDTAVVVQEESADADEKVLVESEWILPECDCGSTETELGKHGETCARKVFLEEFCQETAADIFAKWDKLPEECQAYVLEFLGKDEADAEKLAELKGYVIAAADETIPAEEETEEAPEIGLMATSTGETTVYVIAASDYQNSGSSDTFNASNYTFSAISSRGIAPYGALFCGDYTQYGQDYDADDQKNVKAGIDDLKKLVNYRFQDVQQMIFVQGNHDRLCGTSEGLSTSGNHDTPFYGVYVLNNNDYGWTYNGTCAGDLTTIKNTAKAMKSYFDAKIAAGYDKPIFVAAHIPLHASYRTRAHSENVYSKYIFDVINEAGKELNIIYLFGHNHSASSDSYIGGGSAYLGRGETIFIPQPGKKDATPTKETLNFTYMNAGYLGYVRNENAGGNELSVSLFEITGNKVVIRRYNTNGAIPVRAEGALYSGAGETAATYGLTSAEMTAYMKPAFKTATAVDPDTVSEGAVNGDWVEIPKFNSTAYYQTFQFVEGNTYLLANYGDGTGEWSILGEPSNGNVSSVAATIQHNGRGYFIELSDTSIAKQVEWTWNGFAANSYATMGSLKNGHTGRYLQVDEGGTQGLELAVDANTPAATIRTTSARDTNLGDKKFWAYDSNLRTADKGYKDQYSGLMVLSGTNVNSPDTRNYVLRNGNKNAWAYRLKSGPTGSCGPTYIYAKVTDHYDPNKSSYAKAEIADHIDFYLDQFTSLANMKQFIQNNHLKVSVKDAAGKVTTTGDYILSTNANPNAEGTYSATVSYEGRVLATFEIHVSKAVVETAEIIPAEGTVYQNAAASTQTGSTLTITYDNGVVVEVPVTVGMLKDAAGKAVSTKTVGTQTDLTVVYEGVEVSGYTLRVLDKNYPEYPNPGSVKVEKEGTGIAFEDTGLAQVELSATGVPMIDGVDIIVMVDTSSSMGPQGAETKAESRLAQTHKAVNNLIDTLKENVEAGILGDTKIAIADFNAYKKANSGSDYANQPWGYYALDGNCWVRDPGNPDNSGLHYSTNTSHTHGARTGVTNPLDLSASAFVDVTTLNNNGERWASDTTLGIQSGTNYDFAFDAIYQLGHSIQKYNKEQGLEHRELVVIFMSDGCPFQYNYFMSHAENNIWNHWLNGSLNDAGLKALTGGTPENPSMWEHFYNSNQGRHWMAEAIKGDPNQRYKVIRKSNTNLEDVIELNTAAGANQYAGTLPGLGAQMYTIALGITNGDGKIELNTILGVLERIASKPGDFYNVPDQSKLHDVFQSIAGTITQAATQSYFLDTMGDDYDLYMSDKVLKSDGSYVKDANGNDLVPAIEVRDYTVTGITRSTEPEKVLERITFGGDYRNVPDGTTMTVCQELLNEDGTYTPNTFTMKMGDLLQGKYVYYNTSKTESQTVTYNGKTITLEPETFFYITTTLVANKEFALNYYVYLEDALDSNCDNIAASAGTYPTNKSAVLYYKNYLNKDCSKDTVSPELSWGAPKVNYGFYLVDPEGKIISDETSGTTTTDFSERTEVIASTLFEEFQFNTTSSDIMSHELAKKLIEELADQGYELYVYNEETGKGVTYSVKANSGNGGGSWSIEGDSTGTTYVTGYNGEAYSNSTEGQDPDNYSNTTVWFAVVSMIDCVPDTVVVDFGLPVKIDVTANDKLIGTNGTLAGIGLSENRPANSRPKNGSNQSLQDGFGAALNEGLNYGSAKIEDGNVVYSLETMEMNDAEVFYYAMKYAGETGAKGYYYSTVTVIPATTIYYEDSFVKCSVFNMNGDVIAYDWDSDGNTKTDDQAQDRPGEYSLPEVDANNIYGYDGAYTDMTTYSMGSAKKAVANAEQFAEAQFTFWGTGFDVVSLTSNTSGTITVSVYKTSEFINADGSNNYGAKPVETHMVDTYYGYQYVLREVTYEWDVTPEHPNGHWVRIHVAEPAEGATAETTEFPANPQDGDRFVRVEMTWIVDTNAADTLYQVPVMKVSGLGYDQYTALITVWYEESLDHQNDGKYDFYLDAIRIYDPANDGKNNQVIEDAYVDDGEGWPEYFELRNLIINSETFNNLEDESVNGIVFIDNTKTDGTGYSIENYTNFGPNNELYLAPGQAIAFDLAVPGDVAGIHLAMKSVGGTANVQYYTAAKSGENVVIADQKTMAVATATDLYYDITSLNNKTVVIRNESGSILSITNVKVTYKSEHTDSIESDYFNTTKEGTKLAVASLMMMRPPVAPEEPDIPETTVPEETVPETTVPETTVPEETEPETTVPEEPEESVFEPGKFSVYLSDSNVKVGSDIVVTVYTSKDVDYITINGIKVTRYSGSRYSSTRTWQVRVEAEAVGDMEIEVVCYNSEDQASEAMVKNVTVTEEYTEVIDIIRDLIIGFIGRFW